MDNKLKKQFKKLESLADNKFKEIQKDNYNKYFYIYDVIINFLKNRKDVLLYGGTAINEILPKKYKIYDEYELPDIDIFTTNSKKLIKEIISHYKSKFNEIKLISAGEAHHEGTYKLYAEGLQLADITELPIKDFKYLKKYSLDTSIGIPSVGIRFIKYTLHLLSAQSYDSHRWKNVYDRLIRVYKQYPVDNKDIEWEDFYTNIPLDIYDKLYEWINNNNILSFGWDIIEEIINKPKNISGNPVLYLLYDGDINKLVESLDINDIKISFKNSKGTFTESFYTLTYKKQNICYIFKAESCYSIIPKKNKKVLTLHSIISLLYKMYLYSMTDTLIPVINKLSKKCIEYTTKSSKFNELYSAECYGHQKGIITLRRNKLLRQKQNKNIFTK